jgi:hypothetical protein
MISPVYLSIGGKSNISLIQYVYLHPVVFNYKPQVS